MASANQPTMKLESVKLTNFRGFRELEISFDPSFTILLGENMAGKTAVLEGVAVLLSRRTKDTHGIEDDDIRRLVRRENGVLQLDLQLPVVLSACGVDNDTRQLLKWEVERKFLHFATHDSGNLRVPGPGQDPGVLPIIAYYAVRRNWNWSRSIDELQGIGSRYDAYSTVFNSSSKHNQLTGWIQRQTLIQLQRGAGHVQPQLASVEAAIKSCIGDIRHFWFDVEYNELQLERSNGDIQSFAMLSEGFRNTVAMVADIAWRAAVLNPQYGAEAHLKTDGVVLIDELDLHLHPAWQRRIVGDLRRTFPNIQFIVTTHSPQIVASVTRQQIRLLDRNRLVADEAYVEGRNTNEILEDVFGVPARPGDAQAAIDEMYRLIEDDAFSAARNKLAELEQRFGPDDKDIVRARWLLDLEDPQPIGPAAQP